MTLLRSRGRISPHFHGSEFACPHCKVIEVETDLVLVLEKLREAHGGRPITIRSGYRCPEHNKAVGGAPHSQHMQGRAADIGFGVATPAVAEACGARGIGIAGNWCVHVDVRKGPPARWWY